MKANEAPIKIYLQVCGDCQANECDNCKFEDLEDNVTWCKDKIFDKDVEYTRTDALKQEWKPSKEQLDALHDTAEYVDKSMFPHPKGILMKLYKQLKKLREE